MVFAICGIYVKFNENIELSKNRFCFQLTLQEGVAIRFVRKNVASNTTNNC